MAYITHMLEQYRSTMNWKAKDAALHLVLAVAVMSTSANMGAGELNPNVNLLEIFNSHVLPEIHDLDVNARPIVKVLPCTLHLPFTHRPIHPLTIF